MTENDLDMIKDQLFHYDGLDYEAAQELIEHVEECRAELKDYQSRLERQMVEEKNEMPPNLKGAGAESLAEAAYWRVSNLLGE